MITTHALSILVLVLALAFVLICAGFVYLQHELSKANSRLDKLEGRAAANAPDAAAADRNAARA